MNSRLGARLALALLAVASMIGGIARGEHEVVLKKAVRVCMECIGLG